MYNNCKNIIEPLWYNVLIPYNDFRELKMNTLILLEVLLKSTALCGDWTGWRHIILTQWNMLIEVLQLKKGYKMNTTVNYEQNCGHGGFWVKFRLGHLESFCCSFFSSIQETCGMAFDSHISSPGTLISQACSCVWQRADKGSVLSLPLSSALYSHTVVCHAVWGCWSDHPFSVTVHWQMH